MRFWKWFFLIPFPPLLALFFGVMLMVAYPKVLEVGGVLCPDDKPDTFVVNYTVQTSDGTGTNFTLFCMSERGEIEEVGTWGPLMVVVGICAAVIYGLMLLLVIRGLIRRISRGGDPDPPAGVTGVYLTPEQLAAQQAGQPDPFAALQQDPVPPPETFD